MSSQRLDKLLVERNLVQSRERAQAIIMAGRVYVKGQKEDKSGKKFPEDVDIEVRGDALPFVSRGGLKLQGALDGFGIDPAGMVCLDVGQSTGGFTDVLLKNGAVKVFGVDVGYGQLDQKIRNDPRVVYFERTNFRHFDPELLGEKVALVVIDVSFIGLELILPVAEKCLAEEGEILAMVKPQFEVGKGKVEKGVVKDEKLMKGAVDKVRRFAENELGLFAAGIVESPVTGPKGNREFFLRLCKNPPGPKGI